VSAPGAGPVSTVADQVILGRVPPLVALLRAAHAPPTVAVTALATTVAAAAGRSLGGCVLVCLTVLTGQLSIGWCNDLVDLSRDRAAGRSDKPLVTGEVTPRTVAVSCALAVLLCVPLSFANGWRAGASHLVVVGGGWAYDLGMKRTILSFVPYAVAFSVLTAFLSYGLAGHPAPHAWLLVAGGLLGVGAHFLNVVPDIDADRAAGVLGLPQRLGARASRTAGAVLLAGAAAAVVLGPSGPTPAWALGGLVVAVLLAAAAAVTGRRAGSRLPFLLALATAVATVILLVGRGSSLG
jgi:4-hydroxybenzoate polyprenyltransferase